VFIHARQRSDVSLSASILLFWYDILPAIDSYSAACGTPSSGEIHASHYHFRQFGSRRYGGALLRALDYRYFDKNLMLGLAVQAGMPVKKLVDVSGKPRRLLIKRLFMALHSPVSDLACGPPSPANANAVARISTSSRPQRKASRDHRRGGQAVLAVCRCAPRAHRGASSVSSAMAARQAGSGGARCSHRRDQASVDLSGTSTILI
jgi:hypothetical protein